MVGLQGYMKEQDQIEKHPNADRMKAPQRKIRWQQSHHKGKRVLLHNNNKFNDYNTKSSHKSSETKLRKPKSKNFFLQIQKGEMLQELPDLQSPLI